MRVLDLFSGIGGFSLGLERAGHQTVAFCEIDPFCRSVLARHWPKVPVYKDIKELTGRSLAAAGIECEVICGGFPCQDISVAGRGAGIEGDRSGLWSEYARLVGELRPRYVIVENVAGLLGRGMDKVCGDLAALGYDAEWEIISAFDVGAPHIRERIWIVAYPHGKGLQERFMHSAIQGAARRDDDGKDAALDSWWSVEPDLVRVVHGVPAELDFIGGVIGEQGNYSQAEPETRKRIWKILRTMWECREIAASSPHLYRRRLHDLVPEMSQERASQGWLLGSRIEADEELRDMLKTISSKSFQETQDMLPRVLERIGSKKRPQALGTRVDRLRSLGNAVVPQIPEIIGRALTCRIGATDG